MKNDLILLLATAGAVLAVGLYLTRQRQAAADAAVSSIPVRTTTSTEQLLIGAMGLDQIGRFGDTGGPDADTDVYGAPLNPRDRR